MPAAGHVVAGGLPDRILGYLAEHPEESFRIAELSRAIFPDASSREKATLTVGATVSRLWRTGRLSRTQVSVVGRKVPVTKYRLPDPP